MMKTVQKIALVFSVAIIALMILATFSYYYHEPIISQAHEEIGTVYELNQKNRSFKIKTLTKYTRSLSNVQNIDFAPFLKKLNDSETYRLAIVVSYENIVDPLFKTEVVVLNNICFYPPVVR